jgi:putative ubiquitin-RnfH superfamily antitoxin RatB of RatAB toxin-antitoxin module
MALRIEVVHARSERADVVEVRLPDGATVRDALLAAGMTAERVGIFGKVVKPETRLRDGDRIELYRPLTIDPKDARRRRATRNGRARR